MRVLFCLFESLAYFVINNGLIPFIYVYRNGGMGCIEGGDALPRIVGHLLETATLA